MTPNRNSIASTEDYRAYFHVFESL